MAFTVIETCARLPEGSVAVAVIMLAPWASGTWLATNSLPNTTATTPLTTTPVSWPVALASVPLTKTSVLAMVSASNGDVIVRVIALTVVNVAAAEVVAAP